MEVLISDRYQQQDNNLEEKIQQAIDIYDSDKIGMYGE